MRSRVSVSFRGTRESTPAFVRPRVAQGSFDPYFIIPRRGRCKSIRLQILPRLGCQLAGKIRFIGIDVGRPSFLRFFDRLPHSASEVVVLSSVYQKQPPCRRINTTTRERAAL